MKGLEGYRELRAGEWHGLFLLILNRIGTTFLSIPAIFVESVTASGLFYNYIKNKL